MNLARRTAAEFVGTALLLAVVVGSGIMGERLAGGNVAIALMANSIATGGGLVALILMFGPVSGAHFNPAVSLALAGSRRHAWSDVPGYLLAQFLGGIIGVWAAHAMFGEPILQISAKLRPGMALMFSEVVASFGLLMTIFACVRHRPVAVPYAVAVYIVAAYWFTASTSFANPAVTVARADQYLRRHPALGCARFYRSAARRRRLGNRAGRLALPPDTSRSVECCRTRGRGLRPALVETKPMTAGTFNVLFLCTGNSARSILAECTLNHLGGGRFRAYSAGSHPKGAPNPLALALLEQEGISTAGARSKNWDEFMAPGAPRIDLVVTVCDAAAGEQCPLYPGRPLKLHWGVPDPHTPAEFRSAYLALRKRIERLLALPLESLDPAELTARLRAI